MIGALRGRIAPGDARVVGGQRLRACLFGALLAGASGALAASEGDEPRPGEPPAALRGAAAEEFLERAEVVDREPIGQGVTHSLRLTLADGDRTARAAWKTIDEYAPVKQFHDGGPPVVGFRDSYKNEIAAYAVDKLLGFSLVPPTVERRSGRQTGSLQLWIEDAMTEADRRRLEIAAPDAEAWSRQIYSLRLFRQLIHDSDYQNVSNVLVGPGFRLWAIDHSRSFFNRDLPLEGADVDRFPRQVLDRMRSLDADDLERAAGRWLTGRQRKMVLRRRDRLVERADRLIAERGERVVLFP